MSPLGKRNPDTPFLGTTTIPYERLESQGFKLIGHRQ